MRLEDQDWARVLWRRRQLKPAPAARPFDPDACLKRLRAMRTLREMVSGVPPQLSPEEAWFWMHNLELRLQRQLVKPVTALPSVEEVRTWAGAFYERRPFLYYHYPQTLLPFFTPEQIAALIVRRFDYEQKRRLHTEPFEPAVAFATGVVRFMDNAEQERLRNTLAQAYDHEPDSTTPRACLLLGLLATVGAGERLATYLAGLPKGAWDLQANGRLELLTAVNDEAAFVREVQRLGCRLFSQSDLRLWLAATQWRQLDALTRQILEADSLEVAAPMAQTLALVEAPEAALPMLEVHLSSKAPAIGSEWLFAQPLHAAVGLTPVAMGRGRLATAARDHLRTLKSRGDTAALHAAQAHLTPEQAAWLQREILDPGENSPPELATEALPPALAAALAAVRTAEAPAWVILAALPPILLPGGRLSAPDVCRVLTALHEKPVGASQGPGAALLTVLKAHADAASLDAFAWRVFERWQRIGAPAKDKWALWAVGRLGGDNCALRLTPLVRAWPGERQTTRAVFGLTCLREIGTDTALMALHGIAQKLKFRALKEHAQEMMQHIARSRGLSAEQLADRVVPDCGLDERGGRVFDLGSRQLHFVLGPGLKPLLRDPDGHLRSALPAPTQSDDPDKAAAAATDWKILKKTLREVLKVQARRLEEAMINGRRWTPQELRTLLVNHPLMIHLVRELVLAMYDGDGRVIQTFRVTEDRGFAGPDDEEITLPQSAAIGIVHPVHLDAALISAWGRVQADYEIIPPFAQLGRGVARADPGDLEVPEITGFAGKMIPGAVLYRTLEDAQWLRNPDHAHDRLFMHHSRHFPGARLTAVIRYSPGLSIGSYDEPQELIAVYFVPEHVTTDAWDRADRIRIRDVDPVVLSEVLQLAQALVAKAA